MGSGSIGGVIGIDVGGTSVKAGVVDAEGGVRHLRSIPVTDADRTEQGMVDLLAALVSDLCTAAGEGGVSAVGIGAPGVVDVDEGVIKASPNFPEWKDYSLAARLAEAGVELPIALDNDANVVGLGEGRFGAATGIDSYILLTLGTGVGGALRLGGRLWRGVSGMAGELGHVNVVPDGRPCGCGSRGCLEQYASLNGLRHDVRERSLEIDDAEALLDDPDLPRKLDERAGKGDPDAIALFEQMGYWLGVGVGTLLNVLDVKTVIIAGGLAGALPRFQATMLSTISHHSFPAIHEGLRVIQGNLGARAGVLGAAALIREHLGAD